MQDFLSFEPSFLFYYLCMFVWIEAGLNHIIENVNNQLWRESLELASFKFDKTQTLTSANLFLFIYFEVFSFKLHWRFWNILQITKKNSISIDCNGIYLCCLSIHWLLFYFFAKTSRIWNISWIIINITSII